MSELDEFAEALMGQLSVEINEEKEMNNLIDLGVDGLMTDRPSVLHKVLKDKNLI